MSDDRVEISVVIPCYYAEKFIGELVDETHEALESWCDDYEIILINDGSTDGTWDELVELREASDKVRLVDLMRNFGQHNALYAGISRARKDVVVTMDDDLQHPPEHIETLYEALDEHTDLVYGVPEEEQHGLWRDIASVVTKHAIEYGLGVDFAADSSAFRLFRRSATRSFGTFSGAFVDIDALLCWNTQRVDAVKVPHRPRKYGESSYGFRELVAHAVNMIALFTTLPLRLISIIGFFFTLFGVGVLGYVLITYLLWEISMEGFTFLASIITIFAGAQLFALGVLGEYLARVHFQTLGYPPAVVRRELDRRDASDADSSREDETILEPAVEEAAASSAQP